jgi:hypothetical protein
MFSDAWQSIKEQWWIFFYQCCLVGFPWQWPATPPGRPEMAAARRVSHRAFGLDYHPAVRVLAQTFTALAWLPAVLLHLVHIRCSQSRNEIPMARMPGAFWAALRHNVPPMAYFAFELWRPQARANIDNYLYFGEACRLFKAINRQSAVDVLNDKLAFYHMCKAHNLATPDVLAVYTSKNDLRTRDAHCAHLKDLFVKPRFGSSAQYSESLRKTGEGFVRNSNQCIKRSDLDSYIVARATALDRTLLVQPLLSNHPKLPIKYDDTLLPVRIVTGRTPDGVVLVIFATFHFDGYQKCAVVDLQTGRLSGLDGLENARLPEWSAAVELTRSVHRLCPDYVFVGWDVALAETGAMLLEGNCNWGAGEFQTLSRTPIGLTAFSDVLRKHLLSHESIQTI